jgi:hypothetical protein
MDKFTDKYINDYDILKHAKIGFEFEFFTERPYHKLLELLNRELDVKVSGYRVYHSSFTPEETHWKIEPDLSLGFSGVELISGPIPYVNAKIYLLKVLKILQGPDFSTDDKCSIHINISFDPETSPRVLDNLNRLKLILDVDENFIYKYFPERENNFYAKSVKKIIPFKSYDFSNNAAEILVNSLELPDTKYYGINLLNIFEGRIEYRYIGGDNYEDNTSEILDLMDYFIHLTWTSIDDLNEEDMDKLKSYLSENINQFKSFSKLNNFIAQFPSIVLQVDMDPNLTILKTYYEQFYDELYEIITNIYNLSNCIINYDTEEQQIEIIDATFKTIFDLKKITFIDCVIDGGAFSNCTFVNSEIKNAHLNRCTIEMCDVYKTKIESSKVGSGTILHDCYVFNTLLDGEMKGGIFRSGKLGENAIIDSDVKIVTGNNNYFGGAQNQSMEDKLKAIGGFKNKSNIDKKNIYSGYGSDNTDKGKYTF